MSNGKALQDIAAERTRQMREENWTTAHDDEHIAGELATAAACYASPESVWWGGWWNTKILWWHRKGGYLLWPWGLTWWKPTDQRRNLVKAGALIIAEIDRLDRASALPQGVKP